MSVRLEEDMFWARIDGIRALQERWLWIGGVLLSEMLPGVSADCAAFPKFCLNFIATREGSGNHSTVMDYLGVGGMSTFCAVDWLAWTGWSDCHPPRAKVFSERHQVYPTGLAVIIIHVLESRERPGRLHPPFRLRRKKHLDSFLRSRFRVLRWRRVAQFSHNLLISQFR